jgi:hypothetical protein
VLLLVEYAYNVSRISCLARLGRLFEISKFGIKHAISDKINQAVKEILDIPWVRFAFNWTFIQREHVGENYLHMYTEVGKLSNTSRTGL